MYSAFEVANYFIAKSLQTGKDLSPMKLQKLVYFAHGWYLAMYRKPLINETVEAWRFGPVIPSLYEAFKSYGNNNILLPYKDPLGNVPRIEDIPTLEFLDTIWELYADFSAVQLSNSTHEKGTPWYQTVEPYSKSQMPVPRNKDIEDTLISDYFLKKLNAVRASQS